MSPTGASGRAELRAIARRAMTDHVTVQLLSTDVERGYIDFARV